MKNWIHRKTHSHVQMYLFDIDLEDPMSLLAPTGFLAYICKPRWSERVDVTITQYERGKVVAEVPYKRLNEKEFKVLMDMVAEPDFTYATQ